MRLKLLTEDYRKLGVKGKERVSTLTTILSDVRENKPLPSFDFGPRTLRGKSRRNREVVIFWGSVSEERL